MIEISIGNDHAGVEHKKKILEYLNSKNYEVKNYGTNTQESVDYPDFIHPVARDISIKKSLEIVEIFLKTEFEGGRHKKRIEKIEPPWINCCT